MIKWCAFSDDLRSFPFVHRVRVGVAVKAKVNPVTQMITPFTALADCSFTLERGSKSDSDCSNDSKHTQ